MSADSRAGGLLTPGRAADALSVTSCLDLRASNSPSPSGSRSSRSSRFSVDSRGLVTPVLEGMSGLPAVHADEDGDVIPRDGSCGTASPTATAWGVRLSSKVSCSASAASCSVLSACGW